MNSQQSSSKTFKVLNVKKTKSPELEDLKRPKSGTLRVNIHAKQLKQPIKKPQFFQSVVKKGSVKKRTDSAGQKSKSYSNLKGIGQFVKHEEEPKKSKSPSPNQLYFKKNGSQTINFSKTGDFLQPHWIPGGNASTRHSLEPKVNNYMSAKSSKQEYMPKNDPKRKSLQSSASSNFVRYHTLETTDPSQAEEIMTERENLFFRGSKTLPRNDDFKKPQFNSSEAANLQILKDKYTGNSQQKRRHYASTSPEPIESLVEEENLDPPVADFQKCIFDLQKTNSTMRSKIQKIGQVVSNLAGNSYNLNKEIRSKYVREISNNIENINTLFNDVHFQILKNDDNLSFLDKQWQNNFDQNKNVKKIETLERELRKLTEIHRELQQRMFEQTVENKRVVQNLQNNMTENQDKNYMKNYQIENLEKMLKESREDNKYLIRRIDELSKDLHQSPEPLKPEKPFWRSNSEKLMMQSLKFLTAMRGLQKSLKSEEKDKISQSKQEFEVNKKILEQLLKQTSKMLINDNIVPQDLPAETNREFEQQREQISILMQQLQSQQDQIADFRSQISYKDQEIAKIQGKFEAMAKQNLQLQEPDKKKIKQLQNQIQLLETKPKQQDKILQTSHDSSSSEKMKKEIEQTVEDYEQQLKTQDQAIKNLREQNKALSNTQNEKIEKLNKQISELNQKLEQKNKEIEQILKNQNEKIQDLQSKVQEKEIEMQKMKEKNEGQLNKFQEEKNNLQQEAKNQEKHLQEIILEKNNLIGEQIEKIEKNSQEIERIKQNHSVQIDTLGQAKAALQQEFDNLKKELQSEQENLRKCKEDHKVQLDSQKQAFSDELKQLNDDLTKAEQIRGKHQQTLEKNRDLISLLKEQLQKSVEKQKDKSNDISKQKLELLIQENSKLKKESEKLQNQNETLKEQVKELKLQFQEKMQELKKENSEKEDLINEANKAMEELNEEKHDVKAKFKHLLQVYVMNISQSVNQSSYKGDDSSLSITDCFDQIQEVLENGAQVSKPGVIFSPRDTKALKDDLELHKTKLNDILKKLEIANEMMGQNDEEIQRQANVIDTARRKIQNYKNEMQKKNAMLKTVQQQKEQIEKQVKEMQAKNEIAQKPAAVDLSKQLEQKLKQEFEKKVAVYEQKIKDLEKQKLDKSSSSSSSSDNLEQENLELLAKLQKTEKELQDLRAQKNNSDFVEEKKFDDTKLTQIIEQLKQIQIKLVNAKQEVIQKIQNQFSKEVDQIKQKYVEGILANGEQRKLVNDQIKKVKKIQVNEQTYLIIQNIDESIYFVNKDKLNQQQVDFVSQFMPQFNNEIDLPFSLEDRALNLDKAENPNEHLDSFIQQIKELKNEKQELLNDFYDFKIKLENNVDIEDDKDLHSLKDDLQFYTAENLELRLKIKQLIEYNLKNKARIEELLKKPDASDLSSIFKDASILKGENPQNLASQSLILSNLFDDSVIESINEQTQTEISQHSKNDTKVSVLQAQFEDANLKYLELQNQLQEAKNWGQIKIIKKMGNEEQRSVVIDLSSVDDSRDSGNSYRNLLNHVKGTLITYLKKTPIIEVSNEMLLKIIYSMMNFTSQEINDLQNTRSLLPIYKIDQSATKKRGSSAVNNNSVNNSSVNTDGDNESQKINSKVKSGILGLFKKGQSSRNLENSTGKSSSRQSPKGSSEENPVTQAPIHRYQNKLPDDSDFNL